MVLEGIDGGGKTDQVHRLAMALRKRRLDVLTVGDSKHGEWGASARAWSRGWEHALMPNAATLHDPQWPLMAFCIDRYELAYGVVAPALAAGKIVIADRWEHATWAYQLAAGVPEAAIEHWTWTYRPPMVPDLAFWLQVDPARALARIDRDRISGMRPNLRQRYETDDFLARVAERYDELGVRIASGRCPNLCPLEPVNAHQDRDTVTGELEHRVLHHVYDIQALTHERYPLRDPPDADESE